MGLLNVEAAQIFGWKGKEMKNEINLAPSSDSSLHLCILNLSQSRTADIKIFLKYFLNDIKWWKS